MRNRKLFKAALIIGAVALELVATTSGSHARTYTTCFPLTEDPISEGEKWINGGSIGLDWRNVATKAGIAYGKPDAGRFDDATAILAGKWSSDQEVSATVYTIDQTESRYEELELRLRTSISAHSITGYEINFRCLKTNNAYMEIVRWDGPLGKFTYLARFRGSQYGVTNGDKVLATIKGNTIAVFINGNLKGTVNDNTYAIGSPGIGTYGKRRLNMMNYGFTCFTAADGKDRKH